MNLGGHDSVKRNTYIVFCCCCLPHAITYIVSEKKISIPSVLYYIYSLIKQLLIMFNVLGIQWGSIKHNIQPDAAYSLTYPTQIFFFVKFSSVISYLGPIVLRETKQEYILRMNTFFQGLKQSEVIVWYSLLADDPSRLLRILDYSGLTHTPIKIHCSYPTSLFSPITLLTK